jgi:glutaredoxin
MYTTRQCPYCTMARRPLAALDHAGGLQALR